MPASNERAVIKSATLDADALIFDLEDAVAPDAKDLAREQLRKMLPGLSFEFRERLIRINSLNSPWGHKDVAAVAKMAIDGVVLPKIESPDDLLHAIAALDAAGARLDLPLWVMIETPLGVLNVQSIAAGSRRLAGLIMGTSDLSKDTGIRHTPGRDGFVFALSQCLLAARASDLYAIDGVHLVLDDPDELRSHCEQARDLGYDGKSLIHPRQIATANAVFSPDAQALQHAGSIIAAWDRAQEAGQGVCVLDGRLIENLHVAEARRLLEFGEAINRARTND